MDRVIEDVAAVVACDDNDDDADEPIVNTVGLLVCASDNERTVLETVEVAPPVVDSASKVALNVLVDELLLPVADDVVVEPKDSQ